MIRKSLSLIVACLFITCSDDDNDVISINLNDFKAISESYPYSDLNPAMDFNYLELIIAIVNSPEPNDENLLFSFGELCQDEACATNFRQATTDGGFGPGCLPGSCFRYLKVQRDEQLKIVNTVDSLKEFLGTIDSTSDALLWASVNGYYWAIDDVANGGIKETEDGFELIVRQTVSFCTPVQINRFHLKMASDGSISILSEEVAEVDENACV